MNITDNQPEVVETEETTEVDTNEEVVEDTESIDETESQDESSSEEVDGEEVEESEEVDEDVSKLLELVKGKAKYMDKPIELNDMDTLIENFQKGFDYTRQVEKKKSLETKLGTYDELVKTLYPDKLNSTEQLLQALVDNEIKYIEGQYKDKYLDEADYNKVLKGDERYNSLKNIKPIKFDTEAEVEGFNNEVQSINKTYGEAYSSYKDVPAEVRELAGEKGLSLMEAYKLKNFDTILDKKISNTKKSLMADVAEGRKKTMPKSKSTKSEGYLSIDDIKAMSPRQAADNYKKLQESIKHWQKLGKM